MSAGWLVRVEVEAGRGEVAPFVFIVAVQDHRDAQEAARVSPDVAAQVAKPRTISEPWPISKVELLAPVDARTVERLGMSPGDIWNVHKPPLTDRIQFAVRP
jgi:hypothetical protein